VVGGPESDDPSVQPSALEATLGASQIMQSAIMEAMLRAAGPKVRVIRPDVARFASLDFFAAKRIIQAAESVRDEVTALITS
jgi:predicted acylesterase/phospholipase RssA